MGRVMQIAAFSLAEVTYAVGGDIGYQVQESARSARFRIRAKQENVSGVLLPAFESYLTEGNNDFAMTGLGKGGQQVQRSRDTYARAVEALVELASLQTAFVILDEVIKVVNRRGTLTPLGGGGGVCVCLCESMLIILTVNAMFVFRLPPPQLCSSKRLTRNLILTVSTSSFRGLRTPSNVRAIAHKDPAVIFDTDLTCHSLDINSELDELDREEFYRLKKVAGKKQRDTAAEDEELKARKEALQAAQGGAKAETEEESAPADLLADGDDDDVIF